MSARLGIDLGGTNVRAGLVISGKLAKVSLRAIRAQGTKDEVLEDLYATIDAVMARGVKSIGLGAPSLVHKKTGTILDTTNIPSWKKVPLKKLLEKRYQVPAYLDNDANCFALGEKKAGGDNFVGLILGTGLGAGVIANGHLVSGTDGGAGEFGLIPYKDGILEHYASGQFFRRHGREGAELATAADRGEKAALDLFRDYSAHLAFAVKTILYALAPEKLVLGGSVSRSWRHFEQPLRENLADFAYPSVLKAIRFQISRSRHPAILGAASLGEENPSKIKKLRNK